MKIELKPIQAGNKKDIFAIGCFEGEKISQKIKLLEPDFYAAAEKAFEKKSFEGKKGQMFESSHISYSQGSKIIVLGLGKKKEADKTKFKKTIAGLVKISGNQKAKTVKIFFDSFLGSKLNAEGVSQAFTEIFILSSYRFDKYKTKDKKKQKTNIEFLELVFDKKQNVKKVQQIIEREKKISAMVNYARDLNNEPGNIINPPKLAQEAKRLAKEKKLRCQVLGSPELKKFKMGGILAVNQGSPSEPALIILEHGTQNKKRGTVCLVGKGVTFDSGGISLKPSKNMDEMKYDKSGAISVIAAMGLISDLKLPVHVVGIVPAVENNVAENPQRPGDIIKMYNGKSVEVLNTDAEGRLILADALSYSEKFKPTVIIDIATLTGACVYALGDKACALLGNNRKLVERIKKAGETTGERCWELPFWEEYGECMKGHHSDLQNIGSGHAGTITATMFLKEFVPEKTAWAHLDIAGTAWCTKDRYDCVKGATGFGVRLLAEMLAGWKR